MSAVVHDLTALAPFSAHRGRSKGTLLEGADLFGPTALSPVWT
jgi:hypothetical protein